jgi:histone H3/H4
VQARLKRLLQEDEDVGRVSKAAPVLISKAIELFITDVILQSSSCATSKKRKIITPEDIQEAVQLNDKFDFLRPLFGSDGDDEEKPDEEAVDAEDEDEDAQ